MIYTLNRRNFLVLAAGILGQFSFITENPAKILSLNYGENQLVKIYAHDLQAARAIGRCYLRKTKSEGNADLLAQLIVKGDSTLRGRLHALSSDQIIGILRKSIRKDFETDNIVNVDGWILSKTEARLCALCTLL